MATTIKLGKTVTFLNNARGVARQITGKLTAINGKRAEVTVKSEDNRVYKPFSAQLSVA